MFVTCSFRSRSTSTKKITSGKSSMPFFDNKKTSQAITPFIFMRIQTGKQAKMRKEILQKLPKGKLR